MSEPGDSTLQFAKQLFYHQGERIRIDIRLGFEGEKLKLDGYDIGETVREIWGDSDYEYFITVAGEELEKLYQPLRDRGGAASRSSFSTLPGSFELERGLFELQGLPDRERNPVRESFTWA